MFSQSEQWSCSRWLDRLAFYATLPSFMCSFEYLDKTKDTFELPNQAGTWSIDLGCSCRYEKRWELCSLTQQISQQVWFFSIAMIFADTLMWRAFKKTRHPYPLPRQLSASLTNSHWSWQSKLRYVCQKLEWSICKINVSRNRLW